MRTFLTLFSILFSSLVFSKNLTLKIPGNRKYKNTDIFKLYKYENAYNQEFISDIKSKDNFSYHEITDEVDVYMITNTVDNRFIIVIWDGDVVIDIDSTEFDKSRIKNSPFTIEYQNFLKKRNELYLKPLWKLDSLKNDWKLNGNHTPIQVDSLNLSFNEMFNDNKERFRKYTQSYISNNTDSFISLILLTMQGSETDDPENGLLFDKLTTRLKSHPRAKPYK